MTRTRSSKSRLVDDTSIRKHLEFVNHSCDPNCDVECIRVGFKTPRLVFVAKRDIPIGSEITISYGDGSDHGVGGGRHVNTVRKIAVGRCLGFRNFRFVFV